MQKIKIMKLFFLPEYSILIGHYETTGLQYFNLAKSHVNNTFYFGVDPIHLCGMSTYWFVNIPIRKRLIFEPVQIKNIFWPKILNSNWSI